MTSLRNSKSFLDSICLFKLGLFNAISEASRILRIHLFSGDANKILFAAPENKHIRKILEDSEIASKRPSLNEQIQSKKLLLFCNGVT